MPAEIDMSRFILTRRKISIVTTEPDGTVTCVQPLIGWYFNPGDKEGTPYYVDGYGRLIALTIEDIVVPGRLGVLVEIEEMEGTE